jgi:multidrug efflux pump
VGREEPTIDEINFSEFPIIIVATCRATLPERTLIRLAKDLQDRLEGAVAGARGGLAGTATRCSRW